MFRNEAARIIAKQTAAETTEKNITEKAQDLFETTDWSWEECIGTLRAWMPK